MFGTRPLSWAIMSTERFKYSTIHILLPVFRVSIKLMNYPLNSTNRLTVSLNSYFLNLYCSLLCSNPYFFPYNRIIM